MSTRTAIGTGAERAVVSMAEGAASKAFREALRVLSPAERDGAAVQLAKRYAGLLDAAAVPSAFRAAFARLECLVETKADRNALEKIRDALGAHSVASDLGPKYLAVLAQLGMTPAARGVQAAAPGPVPAVAEPVAEPAGAEAEGTADELRRRRDERAARRGAVDPG